MISSDLICGSLADNLADGLLVSDLGGNIEICNSSFAKIVGYSKSEIIGRPLSQFIKFEEPDGHDTVNGTRAKDDHNDSGDTNGKKDASEKTEFKDAHKPKLISIINTARIDMLMPATHSHIFDDKNNIIGYLTIIYIIQAQSVQQAQTEFVSTVSHELRTPLTSIKGFADTILRAGEKLDKGQQRRYIGIIKDQADRLTRLVEDLLAVSGLESKKLQLTMRAIDLREAIERVLRNLVDKAGNHRIVTDLPAGLPPIWADADRVEQILTNLIDNAVKYSPPGTTVIIAARELCTEPESIEFTVTDQGVGIPQEHLPKIFTKFGRLDNPLIRQTEGTGLGLYITRSLVLALGGQIGVNSKPGQTTFTVQLPATSLEEQAARGRG